MQGVIKAFDPTTGLGSILTDADLKEIDLADGALRGSVFRFLRQGQRVNFDLNGEGSAVNLRFGSESDMRTPTEQPPGT